MRLVNIKDDVPRLLQSNPIPARIPMIRGCREGTSSFVPSIHQLANHPSKAVDQLLIPLTTDLLLRSGDPFFDLSHCSPTQVATCVGVLFFISCPLPLGPFSAFFCLSILSFFIKRTISSSFHCSSVAFSFAFTMLADSPASTLANGFASGIASPKIFSRYSFVRYLKRKTAYCMTCELFNYLLFFLCVCVYVCLAVGISYWVFKCV